MNTLLSIAETSRLIDSGASLALAGAPRALAQLPRGNWIAGTSYYFVGPNGGEKTDSQIFVTDLSALGAVSFARYGAHEMARITSDAPENGFSVVILPAGSEALKQFANRKYSNELFLKPVIGWVAGVDLAEVHAAHAAVMDGHAKTLEEDCAVVAHVSLPSEKMASISILDPFEARDGYIVRFEEPGFSATDCWVNGKKEKLAEFLAKVEYTDGKLPLIGNFSGARINVSIQSVDTAAGKVDFYAPVFAGVDYQLAKPVENYPQRFAEKLASHDSSNVVFSCNCILNYVHGGLEGHRTGKLAGPVTFGEIGYQLLNQTLVMLEVV
jgi:hypothetical protein